MNDGSRKAILAACAANVGISISKFVGFAITGSASMLAEAVHSLADSGNQGLLLLGGKRSNQRATKQHPFGYGRERYFWAFAVALVLFSMGGLFALYEGIEKFRHPHEIEGIWIAIGILCFGLLLESFSLKTAIKESRHVKNPDISWWKFIRTSKQPELPVVLLEDIAAQTGLLLALGGVLIAHWTNDGRWDAVGSISIGVLLIVIAVVLMIEMKGLLIGESASGEDVAAIVRAIDATDAVKQIIHMRTQHLGPDEILVTAKVDFDATLTTAQLAAAIDSTEANIRAAVPAARIIYIEPDIQRTTAASSTDPQEHPA